MPVRFYMDVHIPAAVTQQLRIRGVDVLAAIEEKTNHFPMSNCSNSRQRWDAFSSPTTFGSAHWRSSISGKGNRLLDSSSAPLKVHPLANT